MLVNTPEASTHVGGRIRALRNDRDMTVRGLAKAAGLSVGMVSQVERGITQPSLDTLRHLARALDVAVFDFFHPVEGDDPVAVVRAGRQVKVSSPDGGPTYARLSPGFGRLEMLEGALEPGASSSAEPWSHPSEECVVVTSGTLTVEVAGSTNKLNTGDSCYFHSRLPHRYINDSDAPIRFIVAITPPSY